LYTPPNKTQLHYLPMECCTIQAWQRSIKPLTTDQRARVSLVFEKIRQNTTVEFRLRKRQLFDRINVIKQSKKSSIIVNLMKIDF